MRTTVEFPDDLLRQAKKAALERDITLRALLIEALRRELAVGPVGAGRRVTRALVRTSAGCPVVGMGPEELSAAEAETEIGRIRDLAG